jgi:hypothetical protein
MLDHLLETYANINAVDLEITFENMRRAWDPKHPVDSLFNQTQDCADYSEAGGALICHPYQINAGYAKIFATGHFMSACRRWNEKHTIEKKLDPLQISLCSRLSSTEEDLGRIPCQGGLPLRKYDVSQNGDHMGESTIGALANLETAATAYRGVVAALTQANARLAKHLEENSNKLRELKALLNQELSAKRGQRSFNPSYTN